jgi:hypothetical protein
MMEYWSGGVLEGNARYNNHHSITPSLQAFEFLACAFTELAVFMLK